MVEANHPSASLVRDLSEGARTILEVAKRLFAEKGFNAVSISEIAQQAGVSKANVFHHFSSKEGLYLEVLKAACAETVGSLSEGHCSGNPAEDLWAFFSSQLDAMLQNQASARLILRETVDSEKERARILAEQVFDEYFRRLAGMVREGQGAGLLREDFDPALLAYLMFAANVFFFENHRVTAHLGGGGFARTPDRYSQDAFRLLLKGAQADPETDLRFTVAGREGTDAD